MKQLFRFPLWVLLLVLPFSASSQIDIILRKSFIDSFKHKVSIDSRFKVVHAHAKPNPGSKDGDMHIAGTDTKIGLPVVAEIMNAKDEKEAVNLIHENEQEETKRIKVNGVWRIWCEHAGDEQTQEQGAGFPPIVNTNPDHVFEIHPVLKVKNVDCINSLKTIRGYTYKEATRAFDKYSNVRCKIREVGNDMVSISTAGVGYNYADFWIEIIDDSQFEVEDGRFVICKVVDEEGETIYSKMRMVFPKNSAAELEVKNLQKGDFMHVAGVPRISLALVAFRVKNANNPKYKDILDWNLPMEMIVVSTFNN